MPEGLSTNLHADASADCLVAAGKSFVFRYHSRTTLQPQKRISPKEAAELARAGLDIAAVYQDRAQQASDFGRDRGLQDGASAVIFAGQIGQPPGSAVYFAVDTDFSTAQIRDLVLPYLLGVKEAFDEAGRGTAYHRIGIYGSGLTCRLATTELDFVDFAWLAESTGWRESQVYEAWAVKQHRNDGEMLCDLGKGFERCEAKGEFGQFKPVGFDLRQGEGEIRRVSATQLNLRPAPTTAFNTPITQLPRAQAVQVLGTSAPGWVRVRATLDGADVIGHVNASFLVADDAAGAADLAPVAASVTRVAETVSTITAARPMPKASLAENNPNAKRSTTSGLAFPIGEPDRPGRDAGASTADKCAQLKALADWLGVQTSARFRRTEVTFCNVYAADYGYLADAYLPRVWWIGPALMAIAAGELPSAVLGKTVREMRADDLYAWLGEFGPSFGWRRVMDATALQAAANGGGVGLICADRATPGRPGHITVVVPEDADHTAQRDADGNVTQPLQTQAGAVNRRYGSAGKSWWTGVQFLGAVFYVHD